MGMPFLLLASLNAALRPPPGGVKLGGLKLLLPALSFPNNLFGNTHSSAQSFVWSASVSGMQSPRPPVKASCTIERAVQLATQRMYVQTIGAKAGNSPSGSIYPSGSL